VALFPIEDYKGQLVTNLFEDEQLFADTAVFWELQNAAIAARRDKYLAKGWKAVEVMELGQRFSQYQHTKAAKRDGAKVFVEIGHDGSVKYWEGYLTVAEAKRVKARAAAIEAGEEAPESVTSKAELTQAQAAYVDAHRQAAVRAALVQNPTVAFRLMIASAISGDHNFRVTEDRQINAGEAVQKSLAANGCHQVFTAAQVAALDMLDIEAIRTTQEAADDAEELELQDEVQDDIEDEGDEEAYAFLPRRRLTVTGHHGLTARVFAKLLTLDNTQVMQVAAVLMAEALTAGSEMVEVASVELGANLAGSWTPDALFWEQLRDKAVINAMLGEVAGKAAADAKLTATGKLQKQAMQEALAASTGEAWLPRWLAAVPTTYTTRGGVRPAEIHQRLSSKP